MRFISKKSVNALVLSLLAMGCAGVHNSEAPLRVLVYNIHAGKDAKGVDNIARVAQIVRDTKADVVLRVVNTHIDTSKEDIYRFQEARTVLATGGALRDSSKTVDPSVPRMGFARRLINNSESFKRNRRS